VSIGVYLNASVLNLRHSEAPTLSQEDFAGIEEAGGIDEVFDLPHQLNAFFVFIHRELPFPNSYAMLASAGSFHL